MRIIEAASGINPETLQPEIYVTMVLPLISQNSNLTEDEKHLLIGREFMAAYNEFVANRAT